MVDHHRVALSEDRLHKEIHKMYMNNFDSCLTKRIRLPPGGPLGGPPAPGGPPPGGPLGGGPRGGPPPATY